MEARERVSLKIGLWCNWIFVALTAVGWLGIAHFWAPARPFAYHGLLAFYIPVVVWGVYIALTTWYMLRELGRAPERAQDSARASTATSS